MRSRSFQKNPFPFQLCTRLGIHILSIPTIADLVECSFQPVLPAVDVAEPKPPPYAFLVVESILISPTS